MSAPRVGIVGGGILGLTAALRLLHRGVEVALYERSSDLGGLVGSFDFDGDRADRFYHVVLPTDDRVLGLAEELGLRDRYRARPTQVGFYDDGRLFSMSSLREFLTFPLLPFHDRLRLGAFVAYCQMKSDQESLDDVPLERWLRRLCGKRIMRRLWNPLLDSKFDGRYDGLPATYMWARTRRMSKTRDSAGHELMGAFVGGYQALIERLVERVRELGGEIYANTAVDEVVGTSDGVTGLRVDGRFRPFDLVFCTLAPPQAGRVLPAELAAHTGVERLRYLGVICLLLKVDRSVSPYYTLNITDRRVPLTTIVETTHVVDPEEAGGHLLYVTKYVEPGHPDLKRPVEEVEADYLNYTRTIFPDLQDDEILARIVQRAPVVEPVHLLGGAKLLPDMFPVPGLVLASTAHVYPEIVNGQAVIGVADRAVAGMLARLPGADERRAAA
jgi:protoporphyrinogen oxidase